MENSSAAEIGFKRPLNLHKILFDHFYLVPLYMYHVYETICSSLTQPGTDGGLSPSLSSYSVLIRLF